MHISFPFAILVTCLTALTLGEVKVGFHKVANRQYFLEGSISQDHILFVVDVRNKIACMAICTQDARSLAFTTSPNPNPETSSKPMTCHCYDRMLTSARTVTHVAGSKTYHLIRPDGITEQWLERPCASHSDCPITTVNHVECFVESSQCLCTPGYFYSYSMNDCIQDCPSHHLLTTYIMYPNRFMNGGNIAIINSYTLDQCKNDCNADTRCLTFDARGGRCLTQYVHGMDNPSAFVVKSGYDHYQRTCE